MNPSSPPNELQEVHLQEADTSVAALWVKTLNDVSLPAEQIIAEQTQTEDVETPLAPRFVP